MSIEAVVGRVNQILAMQQQLADPAAAVQSTGGAAAGTTAGGSVPGTGATGTTPASFTAALNSAMASSALGADTSGTSGTAGALSPMLATASPGLDTATATGGLTGLTTAGATGLTTAGATGLTTAGATGLTTAGATGLTTSGATGLTSTPVTATTGSAAGQVQAMTDMANSLVGKPYVLGGGHSGWAPQAGYDCSGFVSAVLHAGGYLSQPADTTALPSQPGMEPGPGQYVTVYDRALPGENGHVIIDINGQFYESGGSRGAWGGGGGVEKIGTPSAAYLAQFPTVLHPAGL